MRVALAVLVVLTLLLVSGVRVTTTNKQDQLTHEYDEVVYSQQQTEAELKRWKDRYAEAVKREDALIRRLETLDGESSAPSYVPRPRVPGGTSYSSGGSSYSSGGDDNDDGGDTIIRRQRTTTVVPEEQHNDPSPSSPPSSKPIVEVPKVPSLPQLPDVRDITKNTPLKDVL
jgi:hypothetical protein